MACDPVTCGATYLDLPLERLQAELTEDALAGGGTNMEVLLARVDAVAEMRIAHASRTDGPQQVAAMLFLRQQHDDVRRMIVGTGGTLPSPPAAGSLPYPLP